MGFREHMAAYMDAERRKSVEINFPDGTKATLYYTPISIVEMGKILTLSEGISSLTHIWTFIEKAENVDGSKCYTVADKAMIESFDWNVVTQFTNRLLKYENIADLKKTSETTRSD